VVGYSVFCFLIKVMMMLITVINVQGIFH
jgi:hypothetical protein